MKKHTNNKSKIIDVLEKPDFKTVMNEYVLKNKPVVIRGVATEWPAFKKWTSPEFVRKYGKTQVITKKGGYQRKSKVFLLSDYLEYIKVTTDEEPYYLSTWSFSYAYPELINDYIVPDYFENWLRRIPEYLLKRKDFDYFLRWMYIGPQKSGSPMHRDPLDTSAWNAVFSGKKEWLFYSTDETENLYKRDHHNCDVDGFNPDIKTHPKFENAQGYTCIQEQGDIVFTPSLWWHQVRNLEAGISLTENFVNHSNINTVTAHYRSILGQDKMLDTALKKYIPEMELLKTS